MKNLIDGLFPTEEEIPQQYRIENEINQKQYLIGGELKTWNGPVQSVLSPIYINSKDGLVQKRLGSYPLLTEKESLEALQAASKAYGNGRGYWPTLPVKGRIEHVETFIENMAKKRSEVVNLLMWEIGKSAGDSAKEFDRTIQYCKDTIDSLKDLDRKSSTFEMEEGVIAQIRRAPLGKVLCMGPFNYPLNETYTTLIPALIMGNTVIMKPAKYGVLLHQPLLEAYQKSFPEGVINMVYGDGRAVIGPLMESGSIDSLAFIGSSKVANILQKQHPKPNRLRSVLGLGAKNPGIILKDADLEQAVKECVQGSLSYNGQRCTALKTIFAHEDVVEEFNERFSQAVENLVPGMPWTPNVSLTPLPEDGKIEYLQGLVEDAKKYGAKVINPSGAQTNKSLFFPAVLYPVNKQMKVYSEEQFGPVVPIIPFKNIEEPLQYVRDSDFGQQASVFGQNSAEIGEIIDNLTNQVSRVNINSQCQRGPDVYPFTGRKDSAEGTLSVSDALRVFSIRSLVAAKNNTKNVDLIKRILAENSSSFLRRDFIF